MPEKFEDFMKKIPEDVAESLEEKEKEDPLLESQSLVNELAVLKNHEGAKDALVGMLPKINELVGELRNLQNTKGNSEEIQSAIVRLVAERDEIEKLIN